MQNGKKLAFIFVLQTMAEDKLSKKITSETELLKELEKWKVIFTNSFVVLPMIVELSIHPIPSREAVLCVCVCSKPC